MSAHPVPEERTEFRAEHRPARGPGGSISRALRVLEGVAAAGDGVTAKALARRLGFTLPTTYRLIGTLVEEGYLVRLNDVRGFGLGYRVAELNRRLIDQVAVTSTIRTIVGTVHRSAGAATYYAVVRDDEVVVAHVDECEKHPHGGPLRVGEPTAAHATACGKVLLAGLDKRRLRGMLPGDVLPRLTPRTLADRWQLDRELQRVRSGGVAVDVEEFVTGLAGIAAPARFPSGEVAGALGISVTRPDFAERRWDLERAVRNAAAEISRSLAEYGDAEPV